MKAIGEDGWGKNSPIAVFMKFWHKNIMKNKIILVLAISLTLPPAMAAQNAMVGWYGLSAAGSFGGLSPRLANFRWSVLHQARLSHPPQPQYDSKPHKLTEDLLFVQFDYRIDDRLHLGLGYTRDWLDRFNENRAYQEIGWHPLPSDTGHWFIRTRLEQRVHEKAARDAVGLRGRELIQWTHPVPGLGGVRFMVNDEVFWYLNSSVWRSDGFSENRAFAGLDIPLMSNKNRLTLGYMNQFVRKGTSKRHLINHILFVNLGTRF